ncbi:MAG: fasciclin domain-containing protein, partial [Polaribacter sp.]|nr:fasciclin domain-containing protein [Polaribacter sp.]
MKRIFKVLAVFLITITLQSCSNDDNDTPIETNTIVDVAVNNQLTSLVAAVTKANLAATLSGPGPFTVLAPTNEAFDEFL